MVTFPAAACAEVPNGYRAAGCCPCSALCRHRCRRRRLAEANPGCRPDRRRRIPLMWQLKTRIPGIGSVSGVETEWRLRALAAVPPNSGRRFSPIRSSVPECGCSDRLRVQVHPIQRQRARRPRSALPSSIIRCRPFQTEDRVKSPYRFFPHQCAGAKNFPTPTRPPEIDALTREISSTPSSNGMLSAPIDGAAHHFPGSPTSPTMYSGSAERTILGGRAPVGRPGTRHHHVRPARMAQADTETTPTVDPDPTPSISSGLPPKGRL